jgi:hypothetical protein
MRSDCLPPGLVEQLLAIEEMSTPDALARLERAPEWGRIQARLRPDSTAEDIAMQAWLVEPRVLARVCNALQLRRLTTFEHAAHKSVERSSPNGPELPPPDHLAIVNLTQALDAWFARHQRGAETACVEVYQMDGEDWFLIRHGDLFKRVAKVDRRQTDIILFRPRRDDVAVYSHRLGELRVNARTKAERELYIEQFGLHLHGRADYFSERHPYTLDPLREAGRDALDPDGLEGIRDIRLCRLAIRLGNAHNEVITREADDLFRCPPVSPLQRGPIPDQGTLERALFEIQFAGMLKPQPVELRVPNVLKLGRRCDPLAVQNWLCQRGFRRGCDSIQFPAYIIE